MSKDLSNWVRRDGGEILLGPKRFEHPTDGTKWSYVIRGVYGRFDVVEIGPSGATFFAAEGYELIPPPEWVYCSVAPQGVIWGQSATRGPDCTHRYIKGDPTTMEVVPDDDF